MFCSRRTSTSRRVVAKVKPSKKKKKRKRIIAHESDNDDEEEQQLRLDAEVPQETAQNKEKPPIEAEPEPEPVPEPQPAELAAEPVKPPEVPSDPVVEAPRDVEMPIDESTPMEEEAPKPQEVAEPQVVAEPPPAEPVPQPVVEEEDFKKKKKVRISFATSSCVLECLTRRFTPELWIILQEPKQRKIRRKVVYGRIMDENERAQEEMTLGRRTRGRKISYLDAMPSDSDEVGFLCLLKLLSKCGLDRVFMLDTF